MHRKKEIITLLYIFIVFWGQAQSKITVDGAEYTKYDKRLITPTFKGIHQISILGVLSIDDEPLFRDMAYGNIDTGMSYGYGLEYHYKVVNKKDLGIYAGGGYEYFPDKYQKVKFLLGYHSNGFSKFIDVFSKYEWIYGWDLNSNATEKQFRIIFVSVKYQSVVAHWGIQTYDADFDDGFNIFQLQYNIQYRRW
jgi:hypothetical protein